MNSWYKHILVIDRSIWRCGGDGKFAHGNLHTLLYNDRDGLMCCLGQACEQSGVRKELMGIKGNPFQLSQVLPKDSYLLKDGLFSKADSLFSNEAIKINDSHKLSRSGRELSLFMAGKRHGIFVKYIGEYTHD